MDLNYSEKERILFSIVGCVDCSDRVEEIIKVLNEGAEDLMAICPEEKNNIKTLVVTKSGRHKGSRVFFVETDIVPENAFRLNDSWTMMKWLEA